MLWFADRLVCQVKVAINEREKLCSLEEGVRHVS